MCPPNAIPFKNLISLDQIIAEVRGVAKTSVGVERDYRGYLASFGTEFDILMRASEEELLKRLPHKVVEGIMKARKGKVSIQPGYDGEYGIISLFDKDSPGEKHEEQLKLF